MDGHRDPTWSSDRLTSSRRDEDRSDDGPTGVLGGGYAVTSQTHARSMEPPSGSISTLGEHPPFSTAPLSPAARRERLLSEIDVVLDVGANAGQYAQWLRSIGYVGRIVSFEPAPEAFARLTQAASIDESWDCMQLALGPFAGDATLRLTANSITNSFLAPTQEHAELEPGLDGLGSTRVPIAPLSSVWSSVVRDEERVYLKVDVEGFELAALQGAAPVLARVSVIEVEVSVADTYEGGSRLPEVVAFMTSRGFQIKALEPNHGDTPDGQMLMLDGLFVNRHARL